MKKISLIAAATLGLVSLSSHAAGTVGSNFDVTVALTAKCQVKTASPGVAFTYSAFQAGAATASSAVVFACTRGFGAAVPTVVLDTGTDATAGPVGQGTAGEGVVGGLRYTLTVGAGALTAGTAATPASGGTADEYSYAISGSMAGGQAGDSSKASTQTRTLTVAY